MSDEKPDPNFRYERVRLATPCKCGSETGVCAYTYAKGLMVSNVWSCIECGATLHEWEWSVTQIACKEAQAQAKIDRGVPDDSVPWDKPPKRKKQMDLF